MSWTIAADVGGTFTDIVAVDDAGFCRSIKVPSTPGHFQQAVADGSVRLLEEVGGSPAAVGRFLHGTTVATNAVLERTGPPTGLITTRGMRDVLEIGRLRIPNSYNLLWKRPAPLAERAHRLELSERLAADGSVLEKPHLDTIAEPVQELWRGGVRTFAISLLHSHVNPAHEQVVAEWLVRQLPNAYVTLGSALVRDEGEFERTSTAVLNAYLQPVVTDYLVALGGALADLGITAPTLVMQSGGGMMTIREACRAPVHILESGPAAGVIAAARVARASGIDRAIAFDMGGTTAKAALIENGEVSVGTEFTVGAEISAMTRLLQGGGYTVRAACVDVAEVGAGGGSIANVDSGGGLQVGPSSAGAVPGPASYGRGGQRATVTDANAVLGYLSSHGLRRGGIEFFPDRAAQVVENDLAKPLGLSVPEAAAAVRVVADRAMAKAIRAVTTERGRDAADHALVVFGGSGPVHAATLAEAVGIRCVIVPPLAGVFSAVGLLWSPVQLTEAARVGGVLDAASGVVAERELQQSTRRLVERLEADGFDGANVAFRRLLELRFVGQAFELSVDLDGDDVDVARIADAFRNAHVETYGHGYDDAPIELVRARVVAIVKEPARDFRPVADHDVGKQRRRRAFFDDAWHDVPAIGRASLSAAVGGPCLIDDPDTTIVVPPDWVARMEGGNVILERLS